MKLTVFIVTVLIAQVSASFFDVFQGAVLTVQNSFGKLISDVVTDVKETVDCTILAVEHVLALSEDATSRYYGKCGNAANNTDLGNSTQHDPSQIEISVQLPSNEEYLQEIDARINKTLSRVLSNYNPHEKLKSVENALAKESEQLSEVSNLVKRELQKISNDSHSVSKPSEGNLHREPSINSILEEIRILENREQNTKNETEAHEIHQVIDKVLDRLNELEATEASENVKLEEILTDLEKNSDGSFIDLRSQFEEWKEEASRQLHDVTNEMELHEILTKHSELVKNNLNHNSSDALIMNSVTFTENDTRSVVENKTNEYEGQLTSSGLLVFNTSNNNETINSNNPTSRNNSKNYVVQSIQITTLSDYAEHLVSTVTISPAVTVTSLNSDQEIIFNETVTERSHNASDNSSIELEFENLNTIHPPSKDTSTNTLPIPLPKSVVETTTVYIPREEIMQAAETNTVILSSAYGQDAINSEQFKNKSVTESITLNETVQPSPNTIVSETDPSISTTWHATDHTINKDNLVQTNKLDENVSYEYNTIQRKIIIKITTTTRNDEITYNQPEYDTTSANTNEIESPHSITTCPANELSTTLETTSYPLKDISTNEISTSNDAPTVLGSSFVTETVAPTTGIDNATENDVSLALTTYQAKYEAKPTASDSVTDEFASTVLGSSFVTETVARTTGTDNATENDVSLALTTYQANYEAKPTASLSASDSVTEEFSSTVIGSSFVTEIVEPTMGTKTGTRNDVSLALTTDQASYEAKTTASLPASDSVTEEFSSTVIGSSFVTEIVEPTMGTKTGTRNDVSLALTTDQASYEAKTTASLPASDSVTEEFSSTVIGSSFVTEMVEPTMVTKTGTGNDVSLALTTDQASYEAKTTASLPASDSVTEEFASTVLGSSFLTEIVEPTMGTKTGTGNDLSLALTTDQASYEAKTTASLPASDSVTEEFASTVLGSSFVTEIVESTMGTENATENDVSLTLTTDQPSYEANTTESLPASDSVTEEFATEYKEEDMNLSTNLDISDSTTTPEINEFSSSVTITVNTDDDLNEDSTDTDLLTSTSTTEESLMMSTESPYVSSNIKTQSASNIAVEDLYPTIGTEPISDTENTVFNNNKTPLAALNKSPFDSPASSNDQMVIENKFYQQESVVSHNFDHASHKLHFTQGGDNSDPNVKRILDILHRNSMETGVSSKSTEDLIKDIPTPTNLLTDSLNINDRPVNSMNPYNSWIPNNPQIMNYKKPPYMPPPYFLDRPIPPIPITTHKPVDNKRRNNYNSPSFDYDSFFHMPQKNSEAHQRALAEAKQLIANSRRSEQIINSVLDYKTKYGVRNIFNNPATLN